MADLAVARNEYQEKYVRQKSYKTTNNGTGIEEDKTKRKTKAEMAE